MLCLDITLNGEKLVTAGGVGTRSIDSSLHFFPDRGAGSFSVAGYATPRADLSQRVFWTHGSLALGDELQVKVIDGVPTSASAVPDSWGEAVPDNEKSCLFCGTSKADGEVMFSAKAGTICEKCVEFAHGTITSLRKKS